MVARIAAALLLAASSLAAPLWLLAQPAHACSCAEYNMERFIENSELIALGTVRSISGDFGDYEVTVDVTEYFKGDAAERITVHDQSLQGPACSPFEPDAEGEPFLLFLYRDRERHLTTSTCNGSASADRIPASELAELRRLVPLAPESTSPPPTDEAAGEESEDQPEWAIPFAIATGSASLAVLALILWRGFRQA